MGARIGRGRARWNTRHAAGDGYVTMILNLAYVIGGTGRACHTPRARTVLLTRTPRRLALRLCSLKPRTSRSR
jgi:hypothetical protein